MSQESLEQRLAKVERQVAILMTAMRNKGRNWIEKVTGSAKGDADFVEVLKLGQAIRDAEVAE